MNTSQIRNQIGRKLSKIYKLDYSNNELKIYLEGPNGEQRAFIIEYQ